MSKSLVLANNNLLIGLDQFGQVYDLYYPYIGLENHTKGKYVHKIGVWVDGIFSWLDDGTWNTSINYQPQTMASDILATNRGLEIEIKFEDTIYNEENIFLRKIEIKNLSKINKKIKIYFNHQFIIYEASGSDTAIYDHEYSLVLHYKGRRVFMIDTESNGHSFDDYSVGLLGIEGKEGTWKDAEDGKLEKNNVEHGPVDSTIGIYFDAEPFSTREVDYWMVAAKTIPKAKELNLLVRKRGLNELLESSKNYWRAWMKTNKIDFQDLPQKYIDLFYKSLLIVCAHTGANGSIIASADSDLLKQGRDAYAYVWARDGALVARTMNRVGYHNLTKQFLEFCTQAITDEGFMLHKYRADGTLGSSWHPWVRNCKSELPIQEDETALVLITLWEYYQSTKDINFVEQNYDRLIKNPANFMVKYINPYIFLPEPTYDLWEEKFGISTFTASTVYGALICAGKFANLLGKTKQQKLYNETAEKIKKSILKYLFKPELGYFVKQLTFNALEPEKNGYYSSETDEFDHNKSLKYELIYDNTLDVSSIYGLYEFGVLDLKDPKLVETINQIWSTLNVKTQTQGVGRYQNDYYFRVDPQTPGNPWIITTLWLVRYNIRIAKNTQDLQSAYFWLDWVLQYAQISGILSEQIDPHTGDQISASPLTWSQAEYIQTIVELVEKKKSL